jgi:DNA-binding MarR family transcriptional regulator
VNKKKFQLEMADRLAEWLSNKTYPFAAEWAAKDLGCEKADISRAIVILRTKGWAIRADMAENRRRDHWFPTLFSFRPPKDKRLSEMISEKTENKG